MDWRDLEIFIGVDLNDSFVLHWELCTDSLIFQLEASLWPECKFYEPPKPNEYTCYKKALLKFTGFTSISGLLPISSVQSTTDLDGSIDYGNIDSLDISNNSYSLSGEFGNVTIQGGEISFVFNT